MINNFKIVFTTYRSEDEKKSEFVKIQDGKKCKDDFINNRIVYKYKN